MSTRASLIFSLLLTPFLSVGQCGGPGGGPVPALGLDAGYVYSRTDGNVYMLPVDANGAGVYDYGLVQGQLPRVSSNRRNLLYTDSVSPASPCVGGYWTRLQWFVGTPFSVAQSRVVGYDFFDADSSIVVADAAGLHHVSFDNVPLTALDTHPQDGGPSVRQQDGLIVCHNPVEGLQLLTTDGSRRTSIPNTTGFDAWPQWSPDGQWILFGRSSTFYAQPDDQLFHLHNYFKIRPDGSGFTPLTAFPVTDSARFVGGGVWGADGQTVVAGGTIAGYDGLWRLRADGSGQLDTIAMFIGGPRINFVGSGPVTSPILLGGVSDANALNATLHPNPATGTAFLTFSRPTTGTGTVQVLDALGRVVQQLTLAGGATQVRLELNNLTPGVYACRWRLPGAQGAHRLVVR